MLANFYADINDPEQAVALTPAQLTAYRDAYFHKKFDQRQEMSLYAHFNAVAQQPRKGSKKKMNRPIDIYDIDKDIKEYERIIKGKKKEEVKEQVKIAQSFNSINEKIKKGGYL